MTRKRISVPVYSTANHSYYFNSENTAMYKDMEILSSVKTVAEKDYQVLNELGEVIYMTRAEYEAKYSFYGSIMERIDKYWFGSVSKKAKLYEIISRAITSFIMISQKEKLQESILEAYSCKRA